jgi:flavin-dependent dehydrogenase
MANASALDKIRVLVVDDIPEMREMPIHGDGILIIGDAAGLEASAHADGVPNAWFSADIAADVAIQAIAKGDTSASFLEKYDDRIKSHLLEDDTGGKRRSEIRPAACFNSTTNLLFKILLILLAGTQMDIAAIVLCQRCGLLFKASPSRQSFRKRSCLLTRDIRKLS